MTTQLSGVDLIAEWDKKLAAADRAIEQLRPWLRSDYVTAEDRTAAGTLLERLPGLAKEIRYVARAMAAHREIARLGRQDVIDIYEAAMANYHQTTIEAIVSEALERTVNLPEG